MGPFSPIPSLIAINVNNTESSWGRYSRAWLRGVDPATLMLVHHPVRTSPVRGSLGALGMFVGETPQCWKLPRLQKTGSAGGATMFGFPAT